VDEQVGDGIVQLPGPILRFLDLHQNVGQFLLLGAGTAPARPYLVSLGSCDRPAMASARDWAAEAGQEYRH
jgi:hypothetical protein